MAETTECACCVALESWLEGYVDHRKNRDRWWNTPSYAQAEADMARRTITMIHGLHRAPTVYSGPAIREGKYE